jgi:lipopolysaccharide cholinephosphotransferase
MGDAEPRFLRLSHEVGMQLLAVLDTACRATGVTYVAFYGTLLGAVRYGDWIPWDDDIDVAMLREDFERFRVACSTHLPSHVRFSDGRSDPEHMTPIPRLLHLGTERVPFARSRTSPPAEARHVALDIFVLDRAPRNRLRHWAWRKRIRAFELMVIARGTSFGDVRANPNRSLLGTCVETAAVLLARLASSDSWRSGYVRACVAHRGTRSPYVSVTNGHPLASRARLLPLRDIVPPQTVRFGDRDAPGPRDARVVLSELYGPTFMTPPPESHRRPLHFNNGLKAHIGDKHEEIYPDRRAVD